MRKDGKKTGLGIKVLLLGSTGLLGSTLRPFLDSRGYNVITHSYSNEAHYRGDLKDSNQVAELLDEVQPEIVVNLVGLTDVERCEGNPNEAYLVNVLSVENISGWIRRSKTSCFLVHISTDQVYDGAGLHSEAQVALTNYYAFSKYAGELAASSVPSTVLRTNFFGLSCCVKRASFTDWLYNSLSNVDAIQVFDDVRFNPVSMGTLSETIELVLQKKPIGIFNLGSHGGMSKADFAFTFAEELDFPTNTLTRTSIDQAAFLNTYRPKDMRMNCSKFEKELGIKLPHITDEIKRVAREYNEKPGFKFRN